METKTLQVIQKLSKMGKIFSKIIKICCIVGACGCLVGLISLTAGGFDSFKIGGVTIHSMLEKSAEMSMGTIYASIVVGLILCIGEGIIARLAEKYFTDEIKAGTPFTLDGAKQLKRLGICTMAISLGSLIAADIAYNIISSSISNVADMHLDDSSQIGLGIAFIIVSLICKYGAEREALRDNEQNS